MTEPKKRGVRRGRNINLYLDNDLIERLRAWGDGSISAGVAKVEDVATKVLVAEITENGAALFGCDMRTLKARS